MRSRALPFLAVVLVCVLAGSAGAQLLVDPGRQPEQRSFEIGAVLGQSSIEYELEDTNGDIDRQFIGDYLAYGITDWIDVNLSLGLIVDAEPDWGEWSDSGSGYMIGVGTRGTIWTWEDLALRGFAELHHIVEDYGEMHSTEADGTLTEMMLGIFAQYEIIPGLSLCGGFDLVPFSDGEADVDYGGGGSEDADLERDSLLNLRLGINYGTGMWWLRGDLVLLGEESALFGGGIRF